MARSPWKIDPTGADGGDPRLGGSGDWEKAKTAGVGGAGIKFGMPGIMEADPNQTLFDWFDWINLAGRGQANVPKGGVGISGSGTFGGGGSAPSASAPTGTVPTAGVPTAAAPASTPSSGFSLFGPGGSAAANSAAGLGGAGAGAGAAGAGGAGAAGAAGAGGATVAGGSWYTNPDLWGAVLGAGSSYLDAESAKKATKNAGKVDITSSRTPWDEGETYILDALARGKSLMEQGRQPTGGAGGGGGGGGARANQAPAAYRSAANADALTNRAAAGHTLYGTSNDYVSGTLTGSGADANRYRDEASNMFGDLSDPNLNAFIQALSGGGGIGRSTPIGGGGGGGGFSSGGGAATTPVGAAQYIKDILNEKYLTENPHSQAVIEAANRRVMEDFAGKQIPGVNSKYAGAGALGSEAWNEALRRSTGAVTDSLADNASSVLYRDYNDRMGDLMQALGLGTQLDMQAVDDATRRAGISASAAGSAGADATRMRIAELGALSDAIGSSVDLTKTGALGMAGLAEMLSEDQRFALGMVPDLTGMDIRDLESAFGSNFALDELGLAERELGSRNANAGADRNWRRYVYEQEAPWNDILRYGDLVGALTGSYGNSREVGTDQRGVSPYTGSPVGQAVAGGLAGWAMGDEYQQRRAQGGA